jgi:hypothetical protein
MAPPSGLPYKPRKLKATYWSNYDRKKYRMNRTEILATLRETREAQARQRLANLNLSRVLASEERQLQIAKATIETDTFLECVDAGKILCTLRDAVPGLAPCAEDMCMLLSRVALEDESCDCSEWCRAVGGKGKEN